MNLNILINNLRNANISKYNKLFKCQQLLGNYQGKEWHKFVNFNFPGNYHRELIHMDSKFDMYVLTWKKRR